MLTPRERFEAFLFRTYEKLNTKYFNGACQVRAIRVARFKRDFVLPGETATLGMYLLDERTIFINYFFARLFERGLGLETVELVLHHEMSHAFLANASQPVRFGQYQPCGGDHGPEFQALFEQHPNHGRSMEPTFRAVAEFTIIESQIRRRTA